MARSTIYLTTRPIGSKIRASTLYLIQGLVNGRNPRRKSTSTSLQHIQSSLESLQTPFLTKLLGTAWITITCTRNGSSISVKLFLSLLLIRGNDGGWARERGMDCWRILPCMMQRYIGIRVQLPLRHPLWAGEEGGH